MNCRFAEKYSRGGAVESPRLPRLSAGFMLMEMMFALGILAAFALLATMLTVATLRIPHQAGEKQDAIVRFQAAAETLRGDVWEAHAIACPDEHTLVLTTAEDKPITWSVINSGLRRVPADEKQMQSWNIEGKLSFSAAGPTAILAVADDAHHADRIEMLSQLMLAAGVRK